MNCFHLRCACKYTVKSCEGTRYFQAINSIGQGPYSPLETCVTPPSSPSSVTIHRHTSTATSITLLWKEPNSNGSDITSYNLEVADKHLTIGAVTKYTIETLKPDTVHK